MALGGHLVTINDAAENTFVFNTFANFGGVERLLWIGLNDAAVEGTFVWASGQPVGFVNWFPGEPNGGPTDGSDYVHMWPPTAFGAIAAGFWNDSANFTSFSNGQIDVPLHGVVEVESVPEPGSFLLVLTGLALARLRRSGQASS
jgi:hypothetical protein